MTQATQATQATKPNPRYITTDELASNLGVTRQTVYNWMHDGRLTAMKIGRKWHVDGAVIDKFSK